MDLERKIRELEYKNLLLTLREIDKSIIGIQFRSNPSEDEGHAFILYEHPEGIPIEKTTYRDNIYIPYYLKPKKVWARYVKVEKTLKELDK